MKPSTGTLTTGRKLFYTLEGNVEEHKLNYILRAEENSV
jgi:hypothetical protein